MFETKTERTYQTGEGPYRTTVKLKRRWRYSDLPYPVRFAVSFTTTLTALALSVVALFWVIEALAQCFMWVTQMYGKRGQVVTIVGVILAGFSFVWSADHVSRD